MLLLLRNVFRTRFAGVRAGRLMQKKTRLFAFVGLAVLPLLIIMQTIDMFSAWLQFSALGQDMIYRFVSTSLFGVFLVLVLTGLSSVMHHFFLAQDLSLLQSLPVARQKVYAQKYIEASLNNVGLFAIVGLPLLISMSVVLNASVFAYVALIASALFFILIPTGIAAILSFVLARLFSVKKMRQVSALLLGFFVLVIWAGFQFFRMSRLNPLVADFDAEALNNFTAFSQLLDRLVLPSDWLVASMRAAHAGNWLILFTNLGLMILFASALFWLTLSWRVKLEGAAVRIDIAARRQKKQRTRQRTRSNMRTLPALVRKDQRLTFRDSRFLQSHVLLMAMLLIVPFVTNMDAENSSGTLSFFMPYMPVTILSLIASSVLARQALPMEKLSFVYLLQAPVSLKTILISKVTRIVLLLTPVVVIAVFVTASKINLTCKPHVLLQAFHFCLVFTGAMLGQMTAVFSTNFNWTDPRYMVNPVSAYLSTLVVLLVGGIGVGIFIIGFYLLQQFVAFFLFFIYVCVVFGICLQVAKNRLDKLNWLY